jgi:DNA-binding CsgD family transcriptional regulator
VGPSIGSALRGRINDVRDGAVAAAGPPGVIVLDRDLRPTSWTTEARSWIEALPAARLFASWGILPAVVYPVAALARSPTTATAGHARERAEDGRWVTIEAAPLEGSLDGSVAIVVRGAAPAETFDLLCRAYALTRRERQVVAALIAGLDTRALTEQLFISRHTVQDHLKSVFGKVGVHSRRELLATFSAAAEGTVGTSTSMRHEEVRK